MPKWIPKTELLRSRLDEGEDEFAPSDIPPEFGGQLWQEMQQARPWDIFKPLEWWGKFAASRMAFPWTKEIQRQMPKWEKPEPSGWLPPVERPMEAYKQWEAPWGVKGAMELGAEMPAWMAMPAPAIGGVFTKLAERVGVGKLVPKALKKPIKPTLPEPLEHKLPSQMPEIIFTPTKARKQTAQVANELSAYLGVVPPKPMLITETTLERGFWQKIGSKLKGLVTRTYRTERLLLRMDRYVEGGKMQQAFWKPVEEATNKKVSGIYNNTGQFNEFLAKNKLDLSRLLTRKVEIDGIPLTSGERIGVYLHSLNPDNLVHVVFGNNIPATTINKVVKSLTSEEKLVAKYLQSFFKEQTPAMQQVVKQVTGKTMEAVENYFPIRISRRAMALGEQEYNQILIDERKLRFAAKWASARVRKGFTLPRTGKAMQPVELDALGTWLNHLEGIEHYKAFAPVISDLQRLLTNPALRRSIIKRDGLPTYQVMEQWLKDVAQTNPLRVASVGEGVLRRLRVNAVSAVLGFNITTSMKQFPSFVSGMAEIGELPALRGLFTSLSHPRQTEQLIKKFAPQIFKRRFEREIAEAAILKSTGQRLMGKISPKEMFMILTTTMDKTAVRGLWRGAFDDGIKKGMTSDAAAEVATRVIRKTQPYFGIKDIPEFWRAGEGLKWLTIFTNQLNQYWNYYRFDIIGKAGAKQISKPEVVRRVMETFVIPSLMIGAISRSRPPETVGEFARDMGSMAFAVVPIMGSFMSSGMKGFYGNQGVVALELFERAQQAIYQGTRAEWLKTATLIPELAGYGVGIPVAQPRRSIMGLVDLASGKTDDWQRLIWGEYTRREAERKKPTEINWERLEELLKKSKPPTGEQPKKEVDWGKLEKLLRK